MSRPLPTGRAGQAIAVLLSLLAVVLIWRLAIAPLVDFYDARQAGLEHREQLAAHVEALAAALPQLSADPRLAAPPPKVTLDGATDAVAAAALQGRLQELALQSGVVLGSAEIIAGEAAGSLRRIGVRTGLSASDAALPRLLAALAANEPPILVGELQIHGNAAAIPPPAGPAASGPAANPAAAGRGPWLEVSFTAYGFRRGQEGGQP